MWARVIETMLGCWLLMSPFIFQHPHSEVAWWVNDLACGALIITLALASYWPPLRRVHLWEIAIGFWLIGFGYLVSDHPSPPSLQNNIILGLLILMMAIIPSHASEPPVSWQPFLEQQKSS